MFRVLVILGTRPEAIKLFPLILHLAARPDEFVARVAVTAQHRLLMDQVLSAFGIAPNYDLDVMRRGQTLSETTARMIAALEPVLQAERPDLVLVQGDTTTTLCGALTAFYHGVPVGHVEAGLRTRDPRQPFPEEINRVLVSRLASLHFAATDGAARNLRAEGVDPARIHVTGNTGIDALLFVRDGLAQARWPGAELPQDDSRKLILVTAHRRESFGEGLERICDALLSLAERPDVRLLYAVHPNPAVAGPVERRLGAHPNIVLTSPLNYVPFVDLMRRAYLILTDSGGIQEEAPSLGKPVLVLREKTERPEGLEGPNVELVGVQPDRIVAAANRLLDDPQGYAQKSQVYYPYGDGQASLRIALAIRSFLAPLSEKPGVC